MKLFNLSLLLLCFTLTVLGLEKDRVAIYLDWRTSRDDLAGDITACVDNGYNIIILGFWLSSGVTDAASSWAKLDPEVKTETLEYVHSKKAKILLSAGSKTDKLEEIIKKQRISGKDYGTEAANFVIMENLDGLDFFLDFPKGDFSLFKDESAIAWASEATTAAKEVLGDSKLITHSAQAQYFGTKAGPKKGYSEIHRLNPKTIDFFLVHFFDQGDAKYITYKTLFVDSGDGSETAVSQIVNHGTPIDKIVVVKPLCHNCGNDRLEPDHLAGISSRARDEIGWDGGVGGWVYVKDEKYILDWGLKMLEMVKGNIEPMLVEPEPKKEGLDERETTAPGKLNVIYLNWKVNWGNIAGDIKTCINNGYNIIILAFWLYTGPLDAAQSWANMAKKDRKAILAYAHSKGAKILVSAGGATEHIDDYIEINSPTGKEYGTKAAKWVKQYNLDGIDFDMELRPGNNAPFKDGTANDWLVEITLAARTLLFNGELIAHAPQAPYFGIWAGEKKGYIDVYKRAPTIDFLNIQFYNQGEPTAYDTYETLFITTGTGGWADETSIMEMVANGIPLDKLVVGKYICEGCGSNGALPLEDFAAIIKKAMKELNFNAGVMAWMYALDDPATLDWGRGMSNILHGRPLDEVVRPKPPAAKYAETPAKGNVVAIYLDWKINWGNLANDIRHAVDSKYTHIILAFYLDHGPTDAAQVWSTLPDSTKKNLIKYCHDAGAYLLVSMGGATEHIEDYIERGKPTGKEYSEKFIKWAKENMFDGVDFDIEFKPGNNKPFHDGEGIEWIVDASDTARELWPTAIISHAPQAPYFGDWAGIRLGYIEVYLRCPHIDFFNIQFYNQGEETAYDTYETLFLESKGWATNTDISSMVKNGVPKNKLVVGKYTCEGCGSNGIMTTERMAGVLARARHELKWKAGAMSWMYVKDDPNVKQWGRTMSDVFAGLIEPLYEEQIVEEVLKADLSETKAPGDIVAIYLDWKINWGNLAEDIKTSADHGYNVIILAFYLHEGSADAAEIWGNFDKQKKQDVLDYIHEKGAVLMASCGGATEEIDHYMQINSPTGTEYGEKFAKWAVKNMLDGVDFDIELEPGKNGTWLTGHAVKWSVEATIAARHILGNKRLISHAPQGPYFSKGWVGEEGGYLEIYRQAKTIDFLNIQFYNQGQDALYDNYEKLFLKSGDGMFSDSSIMEINKNGIPLRKLVLGKYICHSCGSNGHIDEETLAEISARGKNELGWDAGVMAWMYVKEDDEILSWGKTMQQVFGVKAINLETYHTVVLNPDTPKTKTKTKKPTPSTHVKPLPEQTLESSKTHDTPKHTSSQTHASSIHTSSKTHSNPRPTSSASSVATRPSMTSAAAEPSSTAIAPKETQEEVAPEKPLIGIYLTWDINEADIGADITKCIDNGFNTIILGFWEPQKQSYAAHRWESLSAEKKKELIDYAHEKGAKILLGVGSVDHALSKEIESGSNSGKDFGLRAGFYAKKHHLDGIDFHIKLLPGDRTIVENGLMVQWLHDVTKASRAALGHQKIIMHTQDAPYYGSWAGDDHGYVALHKMDPSIDYFQINYYNLPEPLTYLSFKALFEDSGEAFAKGTSIMEIHEKGIPLYKLIIGKQVNSDYASTGYLSTASLAKIMLQAKHIHKYNGGVIGWMYSTHDDTLPKWGHMMSKILK